MNTHGKSASRTLWPVSSGWLAGSFSVTGRICRTGHTCTMLSFSLMPSNSSSRTTSWMQETPPKSVLFLSKIKSTLFQMQHSLKCRSFQVEPGRLWCLCYEVEALACVWLRSFQIPYHRYLHQLRDCRPGEGITFLVSTLKKKRLWRTHHCNNAPSLPEGSARA